MSVAAASPPSSAGGDVHPRPPKEQGRQPTRQIRRNGKKKHVELPEEGPGEDIREEEEARTSSEEEEHEPNVHSRSTQDLANGEGSSKQPTREPTTTNRGLRLTKTGKIQHKWKKAGVARRSTAYNRYLQQQSRLLKEKYPHLSPQERMKMIAEAWPTSEKNPHKSRRRSPYLVAALEREAQAAAAAAAATRLSPIRENSPSGAQPESLPTAVATLWELDSPSASPSRVEIRSMTKHFPPPEPSREE
ncbi:hypothetical protein BGZ73_003671 [Actinomortierella ambigua]|nr:hypothetical protein BGZ73_003671 [Actinomortierella ambigua]